MSKKLRCSVCRQKLSSVWQYVCKCELLLCSKHKSIIDHECTFDWKNNMKTKLREAMPIVKPEKIEKI